MKNKYLYPSIVLITTLLFSAPVLLMGFSVKHFNNQSKLFKPASPQAINFTYSAAGLKTICNGKSTFGDYDNDGDLDVLITGQDTGAVIQTALYDNDGLGNYTLSTIAGNLTPVCSSAAAFGDYDRDGDLDIAISGRNSGNTSTTKIFRNDGTSFTDINATLSAMYLGTLSWVDFDKDGDLDLFAAGVATGGASAVAIMYKNTNNSFADAGAAITALFYPAAAFGDYDNDGDLDLAFQGAITLNGTSTTTTIYKNQGGKFTNSAPSILAGAARGILSWGDYDADGDLDLLQTGSTDAGTVNAITRVYTNGGNGTFTINSSTITNYCYSSAAWGDMDNDGDLDIAIAGLTGGSTRTGKIFENVNGNFTALTTGFAGGSWVSISFGDVDNDGDLDILANYSRLGTGTQYKTGVSGIYINSGGTVVNTVPTVPGLGTASEIAPGIVKINWTAATDAQTATSGLSYALRLGTTKTGVQTLSPMSNLTNGFRRIASSGTWQGTSTDSLKLFAGKYYYSVQAIDGALAGGPFSNTDSVTVLGNPAQDSTRKVTFKLDLGAEVQTGSVWVTGNFNNFTLTTACTLTRGLNNVWSVTVPITLPANTKVLYKFVNTDMQHQEQISGTCASATGTRFFTFPKADTSLPKVCYNKCTACDSVKVTFTVDMPAGLTISPQGVHLAADFHLWNPGSLPMTNAGGTKYTYSQYLSKGTYIEFRFLNGNNWGTSEEHVYGPCAYNPARVPNRFYIVPSHDTVLTYAFGSCTASPTPTPPKIAFVGSSGTFGFGSARPAYMSFPGQFITLLGSNFQGTITNFGRSGTTMEKVVTGVISYWKDINLVYALDFKPDIVLVNLGANDVKSSLFRTTDYARDYKAMLDTFRLVSPQVKFWMGNSFKTGLNTERLVTDSLMPTQQRLSTEWGLPYYDFWTASKVNGFHLLPDSTHPDSAGYAILAQHLFTLWNTPKPTITINSSDLTATAGYAAYWWYRNGVLVSPANGTAGNTIPRTGIGKYKVLVRINNQALDRLVSAEVDVVAGIDQKKENNKLGLYPNPATNNIQLEFKAETGGNAQIEVYDVLGKMVIHENKTLTAGDNQFQLDISNLLSGIYRLRIFSGKSVQESAFVKQGR